MKRSALLSRLLCSSAFAALALAVVGGQQPAPATVFTAAQAQSGQAIYTQNCSACHGTNFEGSGDAPALAGGTFLLKWNPKPVSELFGYIMQSMPPTTPGSLGEPASINVTAYILQRNGAPAGQQALTAALTTPISAVANAQAAAAQAQAPARGRGARGGGGAGGADGAGRGPASIALGAGSTAGQSQ